MKYFSIKKILKPTKLKIIITLLVIVAFIIARRITASSEFPNETLFFKLDSVIFMPVSIVYQIAKSVCVLFSPEIFNQSSCLYIYSLPFLFFPFLLFAFILDIFIYYFLACVVIYILICIKKRVVKK